MSRPSLQALGDATFSRCERVSAELLALTYGSFVRQLLQDYEDPIDVNRQLDSIGYNMGVRLIDDFLAKSKINHCSNFTETADVIAKVAFKMFLGVLATVGPWSQDKKTFGLVFDDNPLAEFAELPEDCKALWYSNVLCGVIRGALEMVNMKVECRFVKDRLRGDEHNEIQVKLHEILVEQARMVHGIPVALMGGMQQWDELYGCEYDCAVGVIIPLAVEGQGTVYYYSRDHSAGEVDHRLLQIGKGMR